MDPIFWNMDDQDKQGFYRMRNIVGRAVLRMVDDDKPGQLHQVELYQGEIRNKVQRVGHFGFGSVPLPGASAVVLFQGGHRGFGSIVGVEDPRYRPTGYKGGEHVAYMVDGAKADGTGGTLRKLAEGLLGWVHNVLGKTINIGTHDDTTTIAANGKTITIKGDSVTITGASGDVIVNGVSLANHVHSGVMSGGADTGPPVASD